MQLFITYHYFYIEGRLKLAIDSWVPELHSADARCELRFLRIGVWGGENALQQVMLLDAFPVRDDLDINHIHTILFICLMPEGLLLSQKLSKTYKLLCADKRVDAVKGMSHRPKLISSWVRPAVRFAWQEVKTLPWAGYAGPDHANRHWHTYSVILQRYSCWAKQYWNNRHRFIRIAKLL